MLVPPFTVQVPVLPDQVKLQPVAWIRLMELPFLVTVRVKLPEGGVGGIRVVVVVVAGIVVVVVVVVVVLVVVVVVVVTLLNVAEQVLSAFMVISHVLFVPHPEQSPPQPAKVESEAGVAVRVTPLPDVKVSEQSAPQSIPDGLLVTVPEPVPALVTDRV